MARETGAPDRTRPLGFSARVFGYLPNCRKPGQAPPLPYIPEIGQTREEGVNEGGLRVVSEGRTARLDPRGRPVRRPARGAWNLRRSQRQAALCDQDAPPTG